MTNTTESPYIRIAKNEDISAVLALYAQDTFNGSCCTIEEAEQVFSKMQSYPFYKLYVAENAGNIIGTFSLLIMDNIARNATPSAIIESVVVHRDQQASGIGKAMMQYAFEVSATAGAYKICLFTGSPNDYVHKFYDALGFERHGISYRLLPTNDGHQ